jgi:hypothetical protein
MTIESVAPVESSIAPWRGDRPWPGILEAAVEGGLCGVALHEAGLPPGSEMQPVLDVVAGGIRITAAEPAVATIVPAPGAEPDPERVRLICLSVRRFAAFDPIAVAFGVGNPGSPDPLSHLEDVRAGIAQIARTGAFLHPHAVFVALLSGSVACRAAELTALIDGLREPTLRVALEVSALRDRSELEHWAGRLDLVATVRLRMRVAYPLSDGVRPVFEAPDLDLRTIAEVLHGAGYRGFYEVEFEAAGEAAGAAPGSDALVELLLAARDRIRAAVRPLLIESSSKKEEGVGAGRR